MSTPVPFDLPPAPPAPVTGEIPVLHVVTTDDIVMRPDFLTVARGLMEDGGPRLALQLRAPRMDARTIHDLAVLLAGAQEASGAWLVVHERVDVAVACGARGVQLTQASLSVAQGRALAPALAIGASAHTLGDVRLASEHGASWIVLDGVRAAREGGAPSGPTLLQRAAASTRVPIIALGGVQPAHVPMLLAAGARGVAAIRGIWDTPNAVAAAREYLSAHEARGPSSRARE